MKINLIALSIKNNLKFLTDFDTDLIKRRRNNVKLLKSLTRQDDDFEKLASSPLDFSDVSVESNLFSLIASHHTLNKTHDESFRRTFEQLNCVLKNPEFKNFNDLKIKTNKNQYENKTHDLLEILILFALDYEELKKSIEFLFENGFKPDPQKNYIFQISKNLTTNFIPQFNTAFSIITLLAQHNCNVDVGQRVQKGFVSVEETPLLLALTANQLTLTKLLLSLGASYNTIYMQTYLMNTNGQSINESFDYLFNIKKANEEKDAIVQALSQVETPQSNVSSSKGKGFKI